MRLIAEFEDGSARNSSKRSGRSSARFSFRRPTKNDECGPMSKNGKPFLAKQKKAFSFRFKNRTSIDIFHQSQIEISQRLKAFDALETLTKEGSYSHLDGSIKKKEYLKPVLERTNTVVGRVAGSEEVSTRVVPVDADGSAVAEPTQETTWQKFLSLFGIKKETIQKQKYWSTQAEVTNVPFGMIHPSNVVLRAWSVFIIMCLAWVGIYLPVDLCFDFTSRSSAKTTFRTVEMIIDYAFWVDLGLYFFIGFRRFEKDRYVIEFSRSAVAYNYLTTWFAVDLVACLSSLTGSFSAFAKVARAPRMVRLLRVVRLVRLFKLFHLRRNLASNFAKKNSTLMKTLRTLALFYVGAHWCGSIWCVSQFLLFSLSAASETCI